MSSASDNNFGPVLEGKFDFTLLFERSMLAIVPAGIAILAIPIYVMTMTSKGKQVRPGRLLWAKLATAIALVGLQLSSVILWHRAGLLRSDISLAASIMSFIASFPSAFVSIYLSITMAFDITMARSYFLRNSIDTLGGLQAAVAGLKLVLVLLEEVPKRQLFRSSSSRPDLGEMVGFWNRSLLLWINSLLRLGFGKNIYVDDLPEIGDKYDSDNLFRKFDLQWKKGSHKSRMLLAMTCFKAMRRDFLMPIIPRLCFIALSFSRPFFMQKVIDNVSTGKASDGVTDGLIGASIFIFGGLMLTRSIFERLEFQAITCVRGMLIMAIYDKAQRLGSDELEKSAAVTLITADLAGVQEGLGYLHSTWSSVLELCLGIYVLYNFVGYACFLLFIPSSISAVGTYIATKNMASARTLWNAKVETRVAATSNILAQLKSVKAMGLTEVLSSHLEEKRKEEIKSSMHERNARIMVYGVYGFGAAMTPVAVLAGARFWTRASNPMTISETFAAYAAVFIASLPLNSLLGFLPYYASGFACLMRIQKFLSLPEMRDQRECLQIDGISDEKPGDAPNNPTQGGCAIEMNNVSVKSDASSYILQDVSLRVPSGSLAMVHGTVGSGKSAFLKALLGELGLDSGTIRVTSKRMAYASQTPWIQNTTIRDNVVGLSPFVEARYNEVISACALDKDLAELPDGDQTMAGSNGCNLSGGQKQRLGLARSIFAGTTILLLDNVLSALDTNTASLVFQRVCGPDGLLRRWNCTVIMTTNQRELRNTIMHCTILTSASPVNLLGEADLVFEMGDHGRIRQNQNCSRTESVRTHAESASQAGSQTEVPDSHVEKETELPTVKAGKSDPEDDELDKNRRHGDTKLYGYFFTTTNVWLFAIWLSATALAAAMERAPQIFLRIWLSVDITNNWYFAGFAAISVAEIIITCSAAGWFLKHILPKSSVELHSRLLHTVMASTLSFISNTDAGSLLNRFSQDISLISQRMPLMLMSAASMFFNVLVDIGIISSGARYTPPIVVFLIAVLYGIQHYYLRTSRQLRYLDLETTAPLISYFTETASGIAHIRGLGWYHAFHKELVTRLNHSQIPFYFLLCVQQWLTLTLDGTTFIAAVTLISITTKVPTSTSESAVGLAMLNLVTFSTTASYFLQMWVALETSLGGLARIQAFCKYTPVETDPTDAEPVPESWPESGRIDYEAVTASYVGPNGEVRPALNDTSFTISHAQKVGISGRTGSGKTSMLLSLLHLMEFNGKISIDGREIKTIPRHILRSRITTMTQDGVEFKGTIRMNVFPFGTANAPADEEIVAALDKVGLWAHLQRRGGLEGDIVDARLSHGQKQLLFLARAMLHQQAMKTKIVLVDEATSALDQGTDARMQELMAEAFADCTVLTIAHQRDGGLDYVDRAIKLDSGHLIELRHVNPNEEWAENF
ncbi:hypothetical protein PWT90_04952 [Aphanocladium album]|nr:hypothetical protein PWT90_04952 [Aphanocladium album]